MFNVCVGAVLMLSTDAANDEAQIHPCTFFLQALLRRDAAQSKGSELTSPYQQPHGAV